jgi:hypothetical protein
LSAYLILGGVIGLPFVVFGLDALRTESWSAAALFFAPVVLGVAWLWSFQLAIVDDVLTYRTLFGGTRSIALPDIQVAKTAFTIARRGPFARLALQPKDKTHDPLVINMKVFCSKDLQTLFDLLGPILQSRRTGLLRSRKTRRANDSGLGENGPD